MKQPILVVDDDEVLGQVLSRVLGRLGYPVRHAATASEALAVSRVQAPCLALVDLCLPDSDGIQLGRDLLVQHPDLILILMTAYPIRLCEDPEWTRVFRKLLTKPLNLSDLRQALDSSLKEQVVEAAIVSASPRLML